MYMLLKKVRIGIWVSGVVVGISGHVVRVSRHGVRIFRQRNHRDLHGLDHFDIRFLAS